jgi:ATP-dependent Clp protease adaptor protein ClpS
MSDPAFRPHRFALITAVAPTVAPERSAQVTRQHYPNYKVIVLNDDFNTFEHVVNCLVKYIPGMTPDRGWELAIQIDSEGQAIVWVGPREQAELYHMQLGMEGLTMAPLEPA